jgi:hypothetical protein
MKELKAELAKQQADLQKKLDYMMGLQKEMVVA